MTQDELARIARVTSLLTALVALVLAMVAFYDLVFWRQAMKLLETLSLLPAIVLCVIAYRLTRDKGVQLQVYRRIFWSCAEGAVILVVGSTVLVYLHQMLSSGPQSEAFYGITAGLYGAGLIQIIVVVSVIFSAVITSHRP